MSTKLLIGGVCVRAQSGRPEEELFKITRSSCVG